MLEDARLVATEKLGRTRVCRLGPDRLDEAASWIDRYRRQQERRYQRLDAYLRQQTQAGSS